MDDGMDVVICVCPDSLFLEPVAPQNWELSNIDVRHHYRISLSTNMSALTTNLRDDEHGWPGHNYDCSTTYHGMRATPMMEKTHFWKVIDFDIRVECVFDFILLGLFLPFLTGYGHVTGLWDGIMGGSMSFTAMRQVLMHAFPY
jgi:hypothetical protein